MNKAILAGIAALAIAPASAMAQWSDDFESYGDGELLFNVGGWTGWDNTMGAAGTATSAQARSGNRSILAGPSADAIHPFAGEFTSGQWSLSAWMFMYRNDHTADTFFIVNNQYNHGGPYVWTIEMQFDVTTQTVLDDFRTETPIAIAYDRWAEIRIDFDLDNDTQTTWYDGQMLSTGTMTRSNGDPLEIANIDLYSTGATSYYDDFNIIPAPGTIALLGLGGLGFAGRRRRRA
ncbi:MAG: PEP-CTERM sorting domain-containing protein [Phycisphaerales bacterium]|nr:PEP-CTERM sorting domain-containing protein [Phycisphaerales bacterium]